MPFGVSFVRVATMNSFLVLDEVQIHPQTGDLPRMGYWSGNFWHSLCCDGPSMQLLSCCFHCLIQRNASWHSSNMWMLHDVSCDIALYYYYCIRLMAFFRDNLVSRLQKGKLFWMLLEEEMIGWQWHQRDYMQTRMWASAQRDGRPAEYRGHPLFKVWLTPTTRVPCSNTAKTRNPLKLAGMPQTTGG